MKQHPEIIAAWARKCSGPGWSNRLVEYAYYQDGMVKIGALQPEEHSDGMMFLFGVSCEINGMMAALVAEKLAGK